MYTLTYQVGPEAAGRRLGAVALGCMRVSHGQLKRLKFNGGIFVDDLPRHTDHLLQPGEVISLRFQDAPRQPGAPGGEGLRVVWEDESLLAVVKPAPLPSLASVHQQGETLENRVFSYLGATEDFVYRPINRLDKGTSGLMLVAKNAHIQQRMQRLLHTEDFTREYLAVTQGIPAEASGLIDLPIGQFNSIRRCISPGGKPAQTDYRVLAQGEGRALLRLRLLTGRTHQIRVHLQALGCPVLGDFLYGEEAAELPGRFALHACALRFRHPLTGGLIDLADPLPPELQALLENLQGQGETGNIFA
ncbi:MAG: RluA family pseudouridine synthase [Christensenellales bacterium]